MENILKLFTADKVIGISPLGNGHINSTNCVTLENAKGEKYRVVLQKINEYVFSDIDGLMKNICSVTDHLRKKTTAEQNSKYSVMRVIPTLSGDSFARTASGSWRCLEMVENTVSYDIMESRDDFYRCASAFADFTGRLSDFPADTLTETIPDFHNTVKRYRDFLQAVDDDRLGRKKTATEEIRMCLDRKHLAGVIADKLANGELPLRVIHNDTKINNILFDRDTNLPMCIVDLDTVMPGAACYDYGDAVRSGASTAEKDETDRNKVQLDMELFSACTEGYMSVAKYFLTSEEIDSFVTAPLVITYEMALRYLTDYLNGDLYFGSKYPLHNLNRCRRNLYLLEDMERKTSVMESIVRNAARC